MYRVHVHVVSQLVSHVTLHVTRCLIYLQEYLEDYFLIKKNVLLFLVMMVQVMIIVEFSYID